MSKKLLLADDSVVIQKLVGLSFANENVEIIATDNGDDAVRLAREVVPDVVLADVVMPGKSGYEVCEAIKQDPALAHIPVLLLTGTFETFDEARAASSGANGQITKPFEAQSLVARVTEELAAAVPAAPTLDEEEPALEEPDLFDANMTSLATDDDLLAETDLSMPVLSVSDSDSQEAIGFQAPESPIPESQMPDLSIPAPVRPDAFDVSEITDPLPPPSGVQQTAEDFMLSDPGESRSALFDSPSNLRSGNDSSTGSSLSENDSSDEIESPTYAAPDGPPDLPPHFSPRPPIPANPPHVSAELPPELPPVEQATIVSDSASSRDDGALLDDPLSGLSEDFGLHDAASMSNVPAEPAPGTKPDSISADSMSGVSAVEVDAALAAGAPDSEATILVGERDSNSQTSPNSTPFARLSLEPSERPVDIESKIDLNPGLDSVPELPPAFTQSPETGYTDDSAPVAQSAAQVTDLDAKLAEPIEDAAVITDFGLGQPSVASDPDLDFAFDVSEQQPADMDDPLDLSYTDLSEPAAQSREASEREPDISISEPLNPLAGDYDVSVSDVSASDASLGDVSVSDAPVRDVPIDDVSVGDVSISEPVRSPFHPASPPPIPLSDTPFVESTEGISIDDAESGSVEGLNSNDDLLIGVSVETESQPVADLSPMMEQQIQETLEKVAWEAFSDLSESIVKQVMDRVEKIAWEVIPQMAETLVREEIRRMKDDKD